ncbi:probable 4-coumarate--CoA ligase 1 isoform X2 [Bradysia coprophila]|uniref:probable 4-coumarate--CoA ligase 1 isoform X2 n=1 Tax=Bradysia coprophila TaxID=38358 RepID=UPI00187DB021|nr:probable 4-coumarate--CoA ligase 1 isoform X2 [Bradysia coprophila]
MVTRTATTYNSELKIWSGPEGGYESNVALGTYIFNYLKSEVVKHPEKVIQIHHETDEKVTVADMHGRSIRLAVAFSEMQLKAGDAVVIVSRNIPLLMPVSVALQYLGVVITYLDESTVLQNAGSNDTALKRIAPRFVICQHSYAETVLKEVVAENILTFDGNDEGFLSVEGLLAKISSIDEKFRPVTIDQPDKVTAVMLTTSGTTGASKFLCLSHASILNQCLSNFVNYGIIFHFVPMNWISGLDGGFGDLIRGKLRITTGERPTPPIFVDVITKHRVTELFLDAGTLAVLAQYFHQTRPNLDSIKLVSCGGTSVSDQLRLCIQDYTPNGVTIIGYGMTEVAGVLAACYKPKGISVGLLCEGIQIKICSPDGTHLGPHETGEICAKTPHEFLDCLNNNPPREEFYDKDGWFLTNDIGYFDDEGFLYILGRKQDMLQHLNHLVNPIVVETILESHEGVFKACVVGVTIPVYYDLPVGIVQRAEGSTVSENELHDFVKDKLPDEYHRLNGGIYFVDTFSRTHTGKIKRLDVKNLALQLYTERVAAELAKH